MPKGIPRNKSVNQKILHRMSIAQGQLTKVISMVRNGDYCIDIINQSSAVQAALKQTNQIILKNHLSTCAVDAAKKGHIESIIKEVISVMDKHDCCCTTCECSKCTCQCDGDTCDCKDCECDKKSCTCTKKESK